MGKTVGELDAQLSSSELTEWIAYASIEPFGDMRADFRAGVIASTLANVNRDPKRGKPTKPIDFMPFAENVEPEEQDEAAAIKAMFYKMGAIRKNDT